jgi:hypothetical protein
VVVPEVQVLSGHKHLIVLQQVQAVAVVELPDQAVVMEDYTVVAVVEKLVLVAVVVMVHKVSSYSRIQ